MSFIFQLNPASLQLRIEKFPNFQYEILSFQILPDLKEINSISFFILIGSPVLICLISVNPNFCIRFANLPSSNFVT